MQLTFFSRFLIALTILIVFTDVYQDFALEIVYWDLSLLTNL